ncbi:hypothetical protein BDY21DRAFT_219692 [Lineolata rhizophorae]|uniref:Uncharacterized protein n=1 Tax=Lineolata rhizophorae TaxID=578093 RepID=A0A6A6P3U3_9PEZI|nr:hypothetical protein BDY21DRAFT_219692 [Lineolata rhizophorae]
MILRAERRRRGKTSGFACNPRGSGAEVRRLLGPWKGSCRNLFLLGASVCLASRDASSGPRLFGPTSNYVGPSWRRWHCKFRASRRECGARLDGRTEDGWDGSPTRDVGAGPSRPLLLLSSSEAIAEARLVPPSPHGWPFQTVALNFVCPGTREAMHVLVCLPTRKY